MSAGNADTLPNTWLVQMASRPTADGTTAAQVKLEQQTFRGNAAKAGLKLSERYAYQSLFNGISVRLSSKADLAKLQRVPGVTAIWPVAIHPIPETRTISPDLAYAVQMTGADYAQNELGLTGKGVKVAVMDTGIDYDNPDLGGDGVARSNSSHFPNSRVVGGYDLVGDAYNADPTSASYNPVATPDAYPDDCAGHGTHVAGIIGANGAVKGVAPDVSLTIYRVFGCEGSTTDEVMIAAMQRVLADHNQVLNMSIGSAFDTWPNSPTALASDRLVNHGVVVVASIGNSGPALYDAGSPGVGSKVIGVASFDNTHITQASFHVDPLDVSYGYNGAEGAPTAPTSGSLALAKPINANGCAASDYAGFPAGAAAIVQRGACTFLVKALNAQAGGAAAVVLYNNTAGGLNPTVAGGAPVTIPVVAITQDDGNAIVTAMGGASQTLTWTAATVTAENPTGGLISSFSSNGFAADLSLKPDIGAPGGFIWSTYPLELGGHTSLSGTSMASPHVAGAVALLLQAKPHTSPQAVRSILQNSADPADWWGYPGIGLTESVFRQGAGMLDIPGAILATTFIDPGKLSLGESSGGPVTKSLKLTNSANVAVTYDLGAFDAVSKFGTFDLTGNDYELGVSTVVFKMGHHAISSVTVPAHGSATISVTISPDPTLTDHSLYGGYLTFDPQGGGASYTVPFGGFKGDYQSIVDLRDAYILDAVGDDHPAAFTLTGGDLPYFWFHLDLQVRSLTADIYRASDNKKMGTAFSFDYMPRNSTETSYFTQAWDGVTMKGNSSHTVADGTYVMKVTVIKPLGNGSNAETWTSDPFTIDRP